MAGPEQKSNWREQQLGFGSHGHLRGEEGAVSHCQWREEERKTTVELGTWLGW